MVRLLNIWLMAKTKPQSSFPDELSTLLFFFLLQSTEGINSLSSTDLEKHPQTYSILIPPWHANLVEENNIPLNNFSPGEKSTRLCKNSKPPALCFALVHLDPKVAGASKSRWKRRHRQRLCQHRTSVQSKAPHSFASYSKGTVTATCRTNPLKTNASTKQRFVRPSPFPCLPDALLLSQRNEWEGNIF